MKKTGTFLVAAGLAAAAAGVCAFIYFLPGVPAYFRLKYSYPGALDTVIEDYPAYDVVYPESRDKRPVLSACGITLTLPEEMKRNNPDSDTESYSTEDGRTNIRFTPSAEQRKDPEDTLTAPDGSGRVMQYGDLVECCNIFGWEVPDTVFELDRELLSLDWDDLHWRERLDCRCLLSLTAGKWELLGGSLGEMYSHVYRYDRDGIEGIVYEVKSENEASTAYSVSLCRKGRYDRVYGLMIRSADRETVQSMLATVSID